MICLYVTLRKLFQWKFLVICVINSSRHRKCFVQGRIHDLFVSKALTRSYLARSGFDTNKLVNITPYKALSMTWTVYYTYHEKFSLKYIFDKKNYWGRFRVRGKFWRRNRQRDRRMRRGSNSHQWICELQTNAVDSKLSFSLKYDLIFLTPNH